MKTRDTIFRTSGNILLWLVLMLLFSGGMQAMALETEPQKIKLPEPRHDGKVSVEKAIHLRRSIRSYKAEPLSLNTISQLLWSSQGKTSPRGYRTAPSAGALYPLEVYLFAFDVTGLNEGVYRYFPNEHAIALTRKGNVREELCKSSLSQSSVKNAPAVLVISAVYERTMRKYGQRGERYVHIEAGHAAQNICLQAVSEGLGSVVVGAFLDHEVNALLNSIPEARPLYVMPIGVPAE
ncbi:MAG: SagB/ThcOx family dehydrogenase [Desulfobacterales bacterium]